MGLVLGSRLPALSSPCSGHTFLCGHHKTIRPANQPASHALYQPSGMWMLLMLMSCAAHDSKKKNKTADPNTPHWVVVGTCRKRGAAVPPQDLLARQRKERGLYLRPSGPTPHHPPSDEQVRGRVTVGAKRRPPMCEFQGSGRGGPAPTQRPRPKKTFPTSQMEDDYHSLASMLHVNMHL